MIAGSESPIDTGLERCTPSPDQSFPEETPTRRREHEGERNAGEDAGSPEERPHSTDHQTKRRYQQQGSALEPTLAVWAAGRHRGASEASVTKQPSLTQEQPGHPTCEENAPDESYNGVTIIRIPLPKKDDCIGSRLCSHRPSASDCAINIRNLII